MKKNYLLSMGLTLLLGAMVLPTSAQVNADNDDDVVKLNANQSRFECVPGQVLLKLKDTQQHKVRRGPGSYAVEGAPQLSAVLQKYGVEEMEQLLPNEKANRQLRKAKAFNGTTVQEHNLSQLYCMTLSEAHALETMQMVDELKALPEVEFAEPNYILHTLEDSNIAGSVGGNPYATSQWYLSSYGVTQLWNKPIVNPTRPVIAIIDTGVDMTHPDLVDNLWTNSAEADGEPNYDNDGNGFAGDVHGWDFINNTPNVRDFNMHGTHVAGIAAASNNGIGIVGANPRALIMPVSVMQSDGSGDVSTIVKGINYAVQNGATVLNMSLGTYANSRALRQALENAYQTAVIVAAAGNDGKQILPVCDPTKPYGPMFPAAYSFVLGIQATTNSGGLASFSNYDCDGPNYSSASSLQDPDGFNYELKAPGTNMLSTIPGGKYKALQGTSMAAPLVAGSISALQMVKNYDTQEILWGDLLHTDNIAQAYAVTARPAELDLVKIMYRERKELGEETEEDYSGDGEIDAGETISLYPVIRTTFGEASNIKMHLEMGDEFEDASTVEILTGEVDFGMHLDAYGKGVSLNPLKLKVADNVADNRHIKMKFVATCDETSTVYEGQFTLVVNNMVKIGGLISEDRTLTADHIYYVNENLGIMEGASLTIEPGTRLEFAEGMGLSSFGKLVANGTPEKPIVFTGHNGALWTGIKSHKSTEKEMVSDGKYLYTNADRTLFTLLPTEQTPKEINNYVNSRAFYKNPRQAVDNFILYDYMTEVYDMTAHRNLLTDPNYLTPAVLRMKADMEEYVNQFPTEPTEQETVIDETYMRIYHPWVTYSNPRDTISYCRIDGYNGDNQIYHPYMKDCMIEPSDRGNFYNFWYDIAGERNNISGIKSNINNVIEGANITKSNIINNDFGFVAHYRELMPYSKLCNNNYLNNFCQWRDNTKYNGKYYSFGNYSTTPNVAKTDYPSYFGTSREDIIRPYIFEMGNAPETYGTVDLSNMLTTPVAEAHGIVWKVVVNGKDAQDEYEELAPLGVGKHKFEVYFNRPMNKLVAPQISFGVRDPYTQHTVSEDGRWNDEGTIYTAYVTITGKTKSDGVNRIYVRGAEDNEFFEIPYEKTRFNVNIQAAGSMATGFMGEAGLGRVNLSWNNENNDFEDAMGFNVYRYQASPDPSQGGETTTEPVRLNQEILDIDATEYVDYDVVPGETYYYYYKVLSTDLQEYDVSNVVAVTPMTSTKGDANGSGDVDVADVITTVNYAAGMEPKPFIFEAADMNSDEMIDILDVIGIIQNILNPTATAPVMVENVATYTVEDGVLYMESPVALAGVQVQIVASPQAEEFEVAADLDGFEHTSAWLSSEDYLFLAYNMNGKTLSAGKHALLTIGDAKIASIRLSNTMGSNVPAVESGTTAIEQSIENAPTTMGIYNLHGQRVATTAGQLPMLPKGVYIVDGKKVIKWK